MSTTDNHSELSAGYLLSSDIRNEHAAPRPIHYNRLDKGGRLAAANSRNGFPKSSVPPFDRSATRIGIGLVYDAAHGYCTCSHSDLNLSCGIRSGFTKKGTFHEFFANRPNLEDRGYSGTIS